MRSYRGYGKVISRNRRCSRRFVLSSPTPQKFTAELLLKRFGLGSDFYFFFR
ncbi:hypothetical protein PPACK8108_LOCUS7293 [Phakopsora pachyrhizi]|uniref:Uncharacterized protein n=1 Tax=Phakopsora pachyrhizi TaxID=170000 RepID=A0AAV0AW25_PHAPC|nr:hypothetical protein PPACK8108_LOCUS7293 [Phakopsora pachyrhizi]